MPRCIASSQSQGVALQQEVALRSELVNRALRDEASHPARWRWRRRGRQHDQGFRASAASAVGLDALQFEDERAVYARVSRVVELARAREWQLALELAPEMLDVPVPTYVAWMNRGGCGRGGC